MRAGAVFRYAYLWHREFLTGQTEGRKDRPTLALAVAISDSDGHRHVLALPITHSQPRNLDHGVLLPSATKQVLGLDSDDSWVITTEAVRFAWPGFDVRPVPGRSSPIYGYVSATLLQSIAQSYLRNRERGEAVAFERFE